MLFIIILFILSVAVLIGWRTGQGVQDEIVPARKYLEYGIDALLLIMIASLLFAYKPVLGIIPLVLAFFRKYLPYMYGALSGVTIAVATLLPVQTQITMFSLCLVMNFLIGATSKKLRWIWLQPAIALVIYLALQF
jgi:hypothetical protein